MARDIKQRCARCGKAISDWHYRKYRKQKSKNKVLARVKSRYGGEL